MPFVKWDVKKDLDNLLEENPKLKKNHIEFNKQYELRKQLLQIRKEKGLSQRDVANKSNLTQQMVSRIENLDNTPSLETFIKYANALDMEIKLEAKI